MKTLSMYIRAAKSEAEAAGIETDGMAESVSKLREEILQLTGGKVDIQIDDKNFKSSFQILKEISEVWDEIGEKSGDVSQANLLNLLGGKRNANVLSSILNNFSDAIDAANTAANSMGSAYAENEKYLDSIEGKTKQVQASFEAFANSVINSDLVKAFLDIQKAILDIARGLSDVGALLPAIVTLGSVIRGISASIKASTAFSMITNILGGTGDIAAKMNSINGIIASLNPRAAGILANSLSSVTSTVAGLDQVQAAAMNASVSMSTLTSAGTKLGSVFANLGSTLINGLAIGGIITLITTGISMIRKAITAERDARDEAINNAKEIDNAYSEATETYKSNVDQIEKLEERFRELSSRLGDNGTQGKLSNEEYEEYLSIVKQLINISPGLISAYNAQGQALKEGYTDIVKDAIEYQKELLKYETDTFLASGDKLFEGYASKMRDIRDSASDLNSNFANTINDSLVDLELGEFEKARATIAEEFKQMGYDISETFTGTGSWLPWDIENSLKTVGESMSLYENMEEILNRMAALRREIKNEETGEIDLVPMFSKDQIAQMRTDLRSYATLWKQYNDINDDVFNYIYTYFKTDLGDLYDKLPFERLAEFQALLKDALDPSMTLGSNKKIAKSFAEVYIQALADIDSALKSGDLETALANLEYKYQNFPTILDVIRAALKGTSDEAHNVAQTNESLAKSYEELAASMDVVTKAMSFLEKVRKGEGTTFDMIKSAQEFVDEFNKMDLEGQISLDDIMSVGENGKLVWDTAAIEKWTTEIVKGALANSKLAQEHPEVVQALVDEALAFKNASDAVVSFSDALGSISDVSDIEKAVEGFKGTDEEMLSILNDVQGVVDTWNKIRDPENQIDASYFISFADGKIDFSKLSAGMTEFKNAMFENSEAAQALETAFPGIIDYLKQMNPAAEDAAEEMLSLSDAMNAFGDVAEAKFDGTFGGEDPIEMIEKAMKYGEMWAKLLNANGGDVGNQWEELLIIDEDGVRENVEAIESMYNDLVDFIVNNEDLQLDEAQKEALRQKLLGWFTDKRTKDEAKKAAEEIKDAFSSIKDAYDFINSADAYTRGESSFYDMLESAYSLVEKFPEISLDQLLNWDGEKITFTTESVTTAVDAMTNKLIADLGLTGEQAEKAAASIKASFEEMEEAATSFGDAMNAVSEVSNLQKAVDGFDGTDEQMMSILTNVQNMVDSWNEIRDATDQIDASYFIDFTDGKIDFSKLSAGMKEYKDAMFANSDAMQALEAKFPGIINYLKQMNPAAEDAGNAIITLTDAMGGFTDVVSALADGTIGGDNPVQLLQNAMKFGEMWQNVLNTMGGDVGNQWEEFLIIDADGIRENTETIEKLYNDLIEFIVTSSDLNLTEEQQNGLRAYLQNWFLTKKQTDEAKKAAEELKKAFTGIQDAYDFMQEHISGERVGDISQLYSDLEKLREITGDETLDLTSFVKWDDSLGDFVYDFGNKTDLLSGKVDEFANNIVAAMGLSGEAAEAAAQKIKSSLGQSLTEFDRLNSTISKIKTIQSFANTVKDYKKGDVGILDVLSEASSSAEELGLELSDLFNFETLEPQLDAAYKAADAMVDKWAEGRNVSAELVQQLKEAARAEQEIQTAQQRVNTGYETWSARRSSSGYTGDNAVTYQEYKELIEADARYGQTLEFVNGQLVINKQRYDEVTAAIGRETVATAQLRIEENKRQIDKLVDQYNNLTDKRGDEAKSILQQIQKLSLESQGYAALAAEVDNASSAMQRFLNASDQVNAGAFDAAQSAYDVIYNTLYNKDSAMYGMKNRDQFKQAMDFVIGANVDVDTSGFDDAFEKIKRYLGQESDAAGLQNFIDDLFSFNLVDSEGNLNTSLENIASTLGITKDMAGSLMKQLSQYFDIDWSEDLESDTEQAKSAFETLAQISDTISKLDTEGLNFEVGETTTSALDALQEQMDALLSKVKEINKAFSGKGPGGETGSTETETQTTTVEVNTEGAEAAAESLNSVAEAKDNATGEATVTTVDDGSENMISALEAVAAKITAVSSMTVRPKGDSSGVSSVVSSLNTVISKINTINGMTVKPKGGRVGGGNTGDGDTGGGSGALGIANAKGGRTLVGELGQEMVVDINSGRFYTVGTNGPEIINLPKDAIVYNHIMTAKLLGKPLQTRVRAQGISKALGDVTGPAMATYTKGKIGKTIDTGKTEDTKKATGVVEEAAEELGDVLDEIKDKYEEINEDLEHYIKHLEQSYYVSERAMDYDSMAGLLSAEAQKYQEIIDNCQAGIRELLGNGADDTSEQVQDLEETMWSAYQSMYEAFDEIRDLYKNALTSEIDNIQSAYKNLYDALSEYNESGKITIDTFQSLLENGIQYLVFLKNENGQYDINTQSIENMLAARKNQLAIETALSYVSRIREALENNEYNTVNSLIDATQSIGSATWDYVFAQAALLKTQGLSNDQYEQLIENLTNLKELTALASDDIEGVGDGKALENIKNKYDALNEQIEHYIEHQERLYKESERGAKYSGMEEATYNKVAYWQQIIANAEQALAEMRAAGATDLDEEVQEMEKVIWDATDNINEAMDSIRTLFTDALSTRLSNIESAFSTMSGAVDEFNENGHITVNTFQSLINGGIEYLALLKKENGQYVVNKDSIKDMIAARKEQLAIESAISYIDRIREALQKGETEKVKQMTDLSEMLSRNSWSVVYAQLASLKTMGLSEEQYQRILGNVQSLQQIAADVALDDVEPTKEEKLDEILTKYSDLNAEIEHYIKHQEFAYSQAERALDYDGMTTALSNEIEYYKQIMQTAQDGIAEMISEGADDTDEALQSLEESYWTAYNSMYDALDNIRKLKVEALTAQIDDLQTAFKNLESAADEYNERGGMTLNTFQSIASAGLQYLGLLEEQGDQYVYSKERVQEYVTAEKEHLAIETALSYISSVREALQNKETERLKNLIDATNTISNSTWSYVYAQAALLKAQGLSDEMYNTLIQNLEKFQAITASTIDDISKGEEKISKLYGEQKNALDKILDFTEDLIKAEANDRIDAIKEEIDAYKEIIDLKKKSLETSKSENEYQKEVAERVEEIAKIQAKYDLLMLDDSRSAAAERLKLQEEIAEKQKNLADYQQDYSYNAQVDALNEEAEAYEESRQGEIEAIENSVSSAEKIYQLAIARIRDHWDTLYKDLIDWNTEQGSVINQEITDNWEKACQAVQKYGSYLEALSALEVATSGTGNIVVADKLPKYHSGGIVGDAGQINDKEVMAVLKKGELVITDDAKEGLYTAVSAVEFLESLGRKIGTAIKNIGTLNPFGAFTPAFAGMATPQTQGYVTQQDVEFNASFNVEVNGVSEGSDAKRVGEQIANTAINNLYNVFNRKGISFTSRLRQG